jgi:hypothetical protein
MNSYFIFPLPMSYILHSNSEADCAMQETQKPNKEIERLENKGGTLSLLVTTGEK